VLGLTAAGLLELFAHGTYNHAASWPGPLAVNAIYIPALCVPFLWRRSRPLAAFATIAVLICVGTLALGGAEATTLFVLLLAAIYSAAAYSDQAWAVAAIGFVTVVVHDLRDPTVHGVTNTLWALGFAAVAWLVSVLAGRGEHLPAGEHRAVRRPHGLGRAEVRRERGRRVRRARLGRCAHVSETWGASIGAERNSMDVDFRWRG